MLPSGLPEHVDDSEELARFLTQRSHYSLASAKPSAFLPSPKSSETSVSRHGREPRDRLWNLGRLATAANNRNLHGAVFLTAAQVRGQLLTADSDEPPDFHAAIRNWPMDSDPELQKAKQKVLALALASTAGEPVFVDS
jgi:hypothetical protein